MHHSKETKHMRSFLEDTAKTFVFKNYGVPQDNVHWLNNANIDTKNIAQSTEAVNQHLGNIYTPIVLCSFYHLILGLIIFQANKKKNQSIKKENLHNTQKTKTNN